MVRPVAVLGNIAFLRPQGLNPDQDFAVEGNTLVAKLTHSETFGQDKKLRFRMVVLFVETASFGI